MKFLKKNDGFTLIEILVVIGIIAILAVIVLIAINPARQFQQARDTQRTSNVNAVLNAIGQYTADNKGDLPTIIGGAITATLCDELVSDYLPALPTDPSSSYDGGDIEDANCSLLDDNVSGYDVDVGADGRITVSAVAEISENNPIEVTR